MADPDNAGATVVDPPQTTQFVKEDGSFVENFHEMMGDEFKNDADTLKRFQSSGVKGLAKSYLEARHKMGRDPATLAVIPTDDSPDDVKLNWKKANGWSEKEEDYKYEIEDQKLKTKVQVDEKKLETAKKFLREDLELSPVKTKKALDFYYQMVGKDIDDYGLVFEQNQKENYEKAVGTLKQFLGTDFDVRSARAKALLQKYGEKEITFKGEKIVPLAKLFEEVPQLKNSAWMTIILDNIAESLSEDSLKGLTAPTTPTKTQIDEQIAELRKEIDKIPRNDRKAISEKRKQLTELYQQKYKG